MGSEKRIVITGIGPLSSIGIGREELWKSVSQRKVNIGEGGYPLDDGDWERYLFHKIDKFDLSNFGIDDESIEAIRQWKDGEEIIDLNYLLAAIKLALDDSGINYRSENNQISLVLSHENLSLTPFALKMSHVAYDLLNGKPDGIPKRKLFDGIFHSCVRTGYDVQAFANLFHIARVFNVHDYSLFINNACASGLYALEAASDIIKSGKNPTAVVAASDYPDIYKFLWFKDLGLYSEDGVVRPFCRDSNGLVFGDGGIALVLEEFKHAQRRGAFIYAEYLGGGFSLEGWKITVPKIGSDSYQKAINEALTRSSVEPSEIDLVSPHGVGSQPIDYYESKAITDIFGKRFERPFVTTFKPYVGHNLGGSSLLEAAILILSLANDTIPATLNCENPDPKFNISLVRESVKTKLKTVLKTCCAFAGFNAAAIFRKVNV